MRFGGYLARMGPGKLHTGFWWAKLKEGGNLEDLGVDGRIIFKSILKCRI
jgi:hypothetical protein